MRFIIKKGPLSNLALYLKKTDIVHLQPDNWDDYTFQTTFYATLYPQMKAEKAISLGVVKILREFQPEKTKTYDFLKADNLLEFEQLDDKYCSLGQDEEFYTMLAEQGEKFYAEYISAMNDVYGNPNIGHRFEEPNNPGFEISLLRSSSAAILYEPLKKAVLGTSFESLYKIPHFSANIQLDGADRPHQLLFDFKKHGDLPNRKFILVGKNGVGKTQVLGRLAFLVSGGASIGINYKGKSSKRRFHFYSWTFS